MNFKKELKISGFLLIAIGIFIIIIQPFSTTGAVIDLSTAISRIWFFIGLGLVGIGVLFEFFGLDGENQIKFRELDSILTEEGRDPESVFILDSSGVMDYKPEIKKLIERFKGRVYAPKRVIEELGRHDSNTGLLNRYFTNENVKRLNPNELNKRGVYSMLRKTRCEAKDALEKTEKHKVYLRLRDIIKNKGKKPDYMHSDDFQDYNQEIDNLNLALQNKYNKDPTAENQLWLLKKHTRVNKPELYVLTNALFIAKYLSNKKAKIFARDSHLREAVDNITSRNHSLKGSLKYINYTDKDTDTDYW